MLKIENVKKKFKDKEILDNISVNFELGKIYGLLGNNGAGKTTLVKIIFQEYSFDAGIIKYNGKDIKDINYQSWYFFSENNELPKNIRVNTYIKIIRNITFLSKELFLKRTNAINKFIDIKPFLKNQIGKLSAGQQKLLSLYLCLLLKPKIIFFDEPTANLDIENKKIILQAIQKLKKQNTLIVIITHLIDEIKELLDHVVIVDNGKIKYNQKFSNEKEDLREIFENNVVRIIDNKNEKLEAYINEIN